MTLTARLAAMKNDAPSSSGIDCATLGLASSLCVPFDEAKGWLEAVSPVPGPVWVLLDMLVAKRGRVAHSAVGGSVVVWAEGLDCDGFTTTEAVMWVKSTMMNG